MRVMVFVKATEDSERGIDPTPETTAMFEAMGKFKADTLPIGSLAKNIVAAQKLLDRAGYR